MASFSIASLFSKGKSLPGLCSLSLSNKGIALVYSKDPLAEKPALSVCEFKPKEATVSMQDALTALVEKHALVGVECIWVLSPEEYTTMMLDALTVPAEELRMAAQWAVKDLIDFPVMEAAVDAFYIPPFGSSHEQTKMYTVVAQMKHLFNVNEILKNSGLRPIAFDITELAIHNISISLNASLSSAATLFLNQQGSMLLMKNEQSLYMCRGIDVDLQRLQPEEGLDNSDVLDDLSLEVQRSFDYFDGQTNFGVPPQLLVAPMPFPSEQIMSHLSENLNTTVLLMDIKEVFSIETLLDPVLQAQCLTAMGAILREKVKK